MTHVSEELRLVLTGLCELTALFLDFFKQPHVFNCDHGLVGEGGYQLDFLVGKGPHPGSTQHQDADYNALAKQRDAEQCAKCVEFLSFRPVIIRIQPNIWDVDHLALQQGTSADCGSS